MKKSRFITISVVGTIMVLSLIFALVSYAHKTIYAMDEAKIEYKVEKSTSMPELFGGWKYVYWRVDNSELKWWLRPFNTWKQAYFVSSGYVLYARDIPEGEKNSTKFNSFNAKQFKALKNECHTLGDMKEHNRKADKEFNAWNYELRKKRQKEEMLNKSKQEWEEAINS